MRPICNILYLYIPILYWYPNLNFSVYLKKTTGGPHKLCDHLYFEFIEAIYGNIENPRSKIYTCHCLTSSNQRGKISETLCSWHVGILLRIPLARILWDFDFLRGLAPGRLDGFSIGRYKKNRKSFDLYAVKFKIGALRFLGGKIAPALEPFQNKFSSLVTLLLHSSEHSTPNPSNG